MRETFSVSRPTWLVPDGFLFGWTARHGAGIAPAELLEHPPEPELFGLFHLLSSYGITRLTLAIVLPTRYWLTSRISPV